jgi:hypothetical protein
MAGRKPSYEAYVNNFNKAKAKGLVTGSLLTEEDFLSQAKVYKERAKKNNMRIGEFILDRQINKRTLNQAKKLNEALDAHGVNLGRNDWIKFRRTGKLALSIDTELYSSIFDRGEDGDYLIIDTLNEAGEPKTIFELSSEAYHKFKDEYGSTQAKLIVARTYWGSE